jgi:glycosyltransferase involved in cell wall biosynthesis
VNILYLSQLVPYPVDAGPKVRSYHVLQYLASVGHDVTLVAFRRATDKPEYLEHLNRYCSEIYTLPMVRSRARDLWYLGLSVLQNQPFLIARDRVGAMSELLDSLIEKKQFDAVHADQLWMAQYALGVRERLNDQESKVMMVLDQHNAVNLIPQRLAENETNPLKRRVLEREARSMKRYELETCRQFDRVVWVTDEDRNIIERASPAPMDSVTIPICVDSETKFNAKRMPSPRRVTFLGGLHWPPNAAGIVWFVREVWPQVLKHVPDAILTVMGKEPPQVIQSKNGGIANLDVTGYVDDPEPFLTQTAVFIVPLHAGGGMRVKIIDAWSWGIPVVSTAVGAEGIKYQDGEDLIIADSKDDFAQAVVRVLTQPLLAERLSINGRQKVETQYDWHITYRAWDQVYPIVSEKTEA